MNNYTPDWVSPPGETIEDLAKEHGLTLNELAAKLGMNPADAATLIDGFSELTDPIAVRLGEIFGTTAEFWRNREAQYREALIPIRQRIEELL